MWLVLLLLAASTARLPAQLEGLNDVWRWTTFSVEDGLPSNRITALLETPNGVPWVSTARGLAWFDGYLWNAVGPRQGLPAEPVSLAVAVRDTNMLVVMGTRFFVGNRSGFKELALKGDSSRSSFTSCAALPSGGILLISSEGFPYVLKGSSLRAAPELRISPQWNMKEVKAGSAGRLLANTPYGLYQGDGRRWKRFLGIENRQTDVAAFSEDANQNGAAWVIRPTEKVGLWIWERGGTPRLHSDEIVPSQPYVLIGARGEVVRVEETGVLRIHRRTGVSIASQAPPALIGSSFAQFRNNGDLWVGKSNGLHLCRLSLDRWRHLPPKSSAPAEAVLAFLRRSDGALWIGTTEGIQVYGADGRYSAVHTPNGEPLRVVTGLAEDARGHVWASSGSAFTGAYRFDGERWRRFGPGDGLEALFYHRIVRDRQGVLWFLGLETGPSPENSGVMRLDGTGLSSWGNEHEPLRSSVYAMCQEAESIYWFGTSKGLSRWAKGVWRQWTTREGLRTDRVFTLAVGRGGDVWFADQTNGLGHLKDGNIRYYRTTDGLVSDAVWEVALDDSGRVWIATRDGASSLLDGVWSTYDYDAGLTNTTLWPLLVEGSTVYFGTVGGGTAVLRRPASPVKYPRVVFERPAVESERAHIRWRAYPWWGEKSPDGLETRFRVDDEPWSIWSLQSAAEFADREAGIHTLVVQAKDLHGGYDPAGAHFAFTVAGSMFLQPTFAIPLFLLACSTVALGWIVLRRRARQRRDLRISEETSRALLNASADPSYLLDAGGGILAMNQAARALPLAPPAGSSFFSMFPPSLAATRRAAFEQVIQNGQPLRLEDQHDGKHFEHSLHPVPDPRGLPTRITFSTRDVTDRRQLEATLSNTVQFLRQILESSTTVAIISTDRQGKVLFWNTGAGNVLGFGTDETVDRVTLETLLPPDDVKARESLMQAMTQVLGGQETVALVMPFRHKDGRNRTLQLTISPQQEGTGQIQGMLLIGEDITERELARRETEQAERQVRLLAFTLNCAKDAFVITDMDNRILYVNQAFVDTYGYTEDELTGKDILIIRSPTVSSELSDSISQGTRSSGWSGEIMNRRKNGEDFPVELWTSTVRNDQGQPVALVGVAREITERKETENQIKASLEEKEILLKEIHHRVKNNLQVITSLLSLQSAKIPNQDIQAILKESQTRVKSMALVHEELYQSEDLSRIDFADYIRRLTTNLFHTYQTGPVHISLLVDIEEVFLTVDTAIPCGLIVNELVSNALKHAFRGRQGGTVTIRLQRDEADFLLTVRDDGVGLAGDIDPAVTETLGLQLVTTLTRQLGGKLSVFRDEGTRFEIRFVEQVPHRRGE